MVKQTKLKGKTRFLWTSKCDVWQDSTTASKCQNWYLNYYIQVTDLWLPISFHCNDWQYFFLIAQWAICLVYIIILIGITSNIKFHCEEKVLRLCSPSTQQIKSRITFCGHNFSPTPEVVPHMSTPKLDGAVGQSRRPRLKREFVVRDLPLNGLRNDRNKTENQGRPRDYVPRFLLQLGKKVT